MPTILPIKDLQDTARISEMCRANDAPIFITKNGYGDLVIMSMNHYEELLAQLDICARLDAAEAQVAQGKVADADASLAEVRARYNV